MSLTTMSYNEARIIIDLYSEILITSKDLGIANRFRYSELKGYDIFDIDRALKLLTAYNVFDRNVIDDQYLIKLKTEANQGGAAVMSFFGLFYPDNIVQQLNRLHAEDPGQFMIRRNELFGNELENELWVSFNKSEGQVSFLEYCLSIEKSDRFYWEKVYERIGITWDDRDKFDPIFMAIHNKSIFFNTTSLDGNPDRELKAKTELAASPTFYQRNKQDLDKVFLILLLFSGLLYSPIRLLNFSLFLLIGFVQLYFGIKEPIINKLGFGLNIIYLIMYVIGILYSQYGFYILIFTILLWTFELFRKRKDITS